MLHHGKLVEVAAAIVVVSSLAPHRTIIIHLKWVHATAWVTVVAGIVVAVLGAAALVHVLLHLGGLLHLRGVMLALSELSIELRVRLLCVVDGRVHRGARAHCILMRWAVRHAHSAVPTGALLVKIWMLLLIRLLRRILVLLVLHGVLLAWVA